MSSVIEESSPFLQAREPASNFAKGANFSGQLKTRWPFVIECPGVTQYLLCFPARWRVDKCQNCTFKCQNLRAEHSKC